jgi:hypothetical protein
MKRVLEKGSLWVWNVGGKWMVATRGEVKRIKDESSATGQEIGRR